MLKIYSWNDWHNLGSKSKESACNARDLGCIPGLGRSLGGEGMAIHSSICAWRIPWTEEPGGAKVHGVAKSRTWQRDLAHTHPLKAANHYQFTIRITIINSIGEFLVQIFLDRLPCVSPVPGPGIQQWLKWRLSCLQEACIQVRETDWQETSKIHGLSNEA